MLGTDIHNFRDTPYPAIRDHWPVARQEDSVDAILQIVRRVSRMYRIQPSTITKSVNFIRFLFHIRLNSNISCLSTSAVRNAPVHKILHARMWIFRGALQKAKSLILPSDPFFSHLLPSSPTPFGLYNETCTSWSRLQPLMRCDKNVKEREKRGRSRLVRHLSLSIVCNVFLNYRYQSIFNLSFSQCGKAV